eukprot:gene12589-16882_t
MTSFLNNLPKKIFKSPDQLIISTKQLVVSMCNFANPIIPNLPNLTTSTKNSDISIDMTKENEAIESSSTISNSTDNGRIIAPVVVEKQSVENYRQLEIKLDKNLVDIKNILYGDIEKPDVDSDKVREIARVIQSEGLFILLVDKIEMVGFEAKKDIALIFNNLLRKNIHNFSSYLSENLNIIDRLVEGHINPECALSCGSMLRECIRHDVLAKYLLESSHLWKFFDTYVHLPNFDVASDAFNTLKELLTTPKNKLISSDFFDKNYNHVISKYEILLQSENYVTKRRSLTLLSEILLDRSNYNVMMQFISSKHNLKLIMNLLRHKSLNIQLETFHVFKIFVANPKKTDEIASILFKNKTKLVTYLNGFHLDKDDPQFIAEKRLLIETLSSMTDTIPTSDSMKASLDSNVKADNINSIDLSAVNPLVMNDTTTQMAHLSINNS